jgi:hypothetical protein
MPTPSNGVESNSENVQQIIMFVNGKWTKFIKRKYQIFDNSLYFQLGAKLGSNKTKKQEGWKM